MQFRSVTRFIVLCIQLLVTVGFTASAQTPVSADKGDEAEMGNKARQRDQQAIDDALNGWWRRSMKTQDRRVQWWREARFGMFIHWGVYSLPGGEWKGRPVGGYAEHLMRKEKITKAEYLQLAHRFDPRQFNADEWVRLAKKAGMRYLIITAKHHDGFAMYDSKVSDFNVVRQTAWGHDPMADIAAACRKYGLRFGFYYSHAFDWEHPDAPGNDWEYNNPGGDKNLFGGGNWYDVHPELLPKAINYVNQKAIPQIAELLRKYHPDILWFDTPGKLPLSENIRILKAIRAIDTTVVINGRLARDGRIDFGDYKNTADRPEEFYPVEGDWEAIPTTNESYGYSKFDNSHKPAGFFIQLLAKAAARGGNLLMNIGPMGDGAFDPRDRHILEGIGDWTADNGQSIYGTVRSGLPQQSWGVTTAKGNNLYLHVFDWPADGRLNLGGLKSAVAKAWLLKDRGRKPLAVRRIDSSDIIISVPGRAPDPYNSVVVLQLERPVRADSVRYIAPNTRLTRMLAYDADGTGRGFSFGDGKTNRYYVDGWKSKDQVLRWTFRTSKPDSFKIIFKYLSGADCGGTYQWTLDGRSQIANVLNGSAAVHVQEAPAAVLPAGVHTLTIAPLEITGSRLMRLLEAQLLTLSSPRQVVLLDSGWKFMKGDVSLAGAPGYNDSAWETVRVPNDWAIKGPFDRLRTGRTGGLPWTGVGWYRKKFSVPVTDKDKRCFIEFDGAMSHAVVYLNGEEIGRWPYGYASFSFELTPHLRYGAENVLAVRLENPEESSRWYPGAGLYRNVRLVLTDAIHIPQWGTAVTTPRVNDSTALIRIRTTVVNASGKPRPVVLHTNISDPAGRTVATGSDTIRVGASSVVEQQLRVPDPLRWDIATPRLYTARLSLFVDGVWVDGVATPFGIRTAAFDADSGFVLNGKRVKLQGVCLHHDLGPLGAAVDKPAIRRQLDLLKTMGCNAIRTSHNPPAPELLDLCDEMGFVVMDEAFDEWKIAKCKNGYHLLFDQWAEKDLRAMIQRDRNHPSVVLWSIGNEVADQREKEGANTARFLAGIAHDEDPTRPVTSAFNRLADAMKNGLADAVDVVGFNYQSANYGKVHKEHPQWKLLGSETESAVSSRGEYKLPAIEKKGVKYPDKQASSYDLEAPKWGCAPDVEFAFQDSAAFVAGAFVWTGFDYLGEPTPYNNDWPSHSSYFGILDLAGLPKDRYYLYQSKWSGKKVLHILPHWNWAAGDVVPVHCYTSWPAAELFVNGKSRGVRRKDTGTKYGRYRLVWDSVSLEPGEIKVVAMDARGVPADSAFVRTAGEPMGVRLEARTWHDGERLSFITVQAVDKDGNLCPKDSSEIRFRVTGAGSILGVCNGDATSVEGLTGQSMRLFNGQCVLVVRSSGPGGVTVSAAGGRLKEQTITLDNEN